MNRLLIFFLGIVVTSTIESRSSIFHRLSQRQQAIFFECVPTLAGASIPFIKRKPIKICVVAVFCGYSWYITHRWGHYNQCTQSELYKHIIVGLVAGYIIAGIKQHNEPDEESPASLRKSLAPA